MPEGKGTYGSKRGRPSNESKIQLGKEKIAIKKGALREQLKVPKGRKIPMSLLNEIIDKETGQMITNPYTQRKQKVTEILSNRANLAKTLKGLKK